MRTISLSDICAYRSEAVSVELALHNNYVSTESMLPNKGGIEKAASIPASGKVKRFRQGDTLVSNIRPYFKKIWHASIDGTCSNDVLVFTPSDCDNEFLYWVLSDDKFFDYAVTTSKGTKMPRGDKDAIMDYQVPLFTSDEQRAICSTLRPTQEKLKLNNRINDYLEQYARLQFEKAVAAHSELLAFESIIELEDSKRVPLNSREREHRRGIYPYYGATSVMDYVDDYLFDGIRVLLGEDGSVIHDDGTPVLQYVWGKYWVNNHAHILKPSDQYSLEMIYLALKRITVSHIVTGAVQKKISQKSLNRLLLKMPKPDSCPDLPCLFAAYRANVEQVKKLELLRDTLLPKLMSGEIDVSQVDTMQLNNHLCDC